MGFRTWPWYSPLDVFDVIFFLFASLLIIPSIEKIKHAIPSIVGRWKCKYGRCNVAFLRMTLLQPRLGHQNRPGVSDFFLTRHN